MRHVRHLCVSCAVVCTMTVSTDTHVRDASYAFPSLPLSLSLPTANPFSLLQLKVCPHVCLVQWNRTSKPSPLQMVR